MHKPQGSAIGTLVEWQARMAWSWQLQFRDGDTLHEALKARMDVVPPGLLRSITWDQRTEIARRLSRSRSRWAYGCSFATHARLGSVGRMRTVSDG